MEETQIDYSPKLDELINQNTELINQNNQLKEDLRIIRDYIEITEEEQQQLDLKNKELEDKRLEEKELDKQFLLDNFKDSVTNEELKMELIKVNESLNSGIEVNKYQVNQDYILLIGLVLVFVCTFIYYIIKKFIY